MPRPLPVLLITFNRPDLAAVTAQRIADYGPSAVFLASDGPRNERERVVVNETRSAVLRALGETAVYTLFHEDNLGCRRAVESAISWFFEHVEEGIVLEDDCVPSRSFFEFCEQMLDRYRTDTRVMHISGYYGGLPTAGSYIFSQFPRVWGWATWRRAWLLHDPDGPRPLTSPSVAGAFGSPGQARYFLGKLSEVQEGTLDTWDFGWAATVVINRATAVQPLLNLVTNTGVGDSRAAHTTRFRPEVSANSATEYSGEWHGPSRVSPDFAYDRRTFRTEIASPSARFKSALPPKMRSALTRLIRQLRASFPAARR